MSNIEKKHNGEIYAEEEEYMDITKGRDWRIEFLRFMVTLGIAIFHFEWIYLGHPVFFGHFYLFGKRFITNRIADPQLL